jgi:uncharacterized protein (TIGR00369 family)
VNPDRLVIAAFLAGDGSPCMIDSNPLARGLRAELVAVESASGAVEMRFLAGPEHLQGAGQVQGGLIAAMLDFALAFALLARLPPDTTHATASLNVHFIRAVSAGALSASARVERLGGRLGFASARLCRTTTDGELLATATAAMALLRTPPRGGARGPAAGG